MGWSYWIAEVPKQAVLRLTKGSQRTVLICIFQKKGTTEVKMIPVSFIFILRLGLNLIPYKPVCVLHEA